MNNFWTKLIGHSMSPLLRNQDDILISQVLEKELRCGDILLFLDQQSKELTLHRLIAFPLKTKGDFSLWAEINPAASCLGRAVGFKRSGLYRKLPSSNSLYTKLFLHLSKLRMKGFIIRKLALIFLFTLTIIFEFCSDKTKLDHNEELLLTDP